MADASLHLKYQNIKMYNHHHDSISKFHFQHGLDKCKFDHAVFDTSLNELIVNNKLLTPLYYTHLSLIGQKPLIKKSKKSIANFKLRPNMVIGTMTTLHPSSRAFKSYFKHLHLCFLPSIKRQTEDLEVKLGVIGERSSWRTRSLKGSVNKGQLSIGVSDLTFIYSFFLLPSLFYNLNNLGGGDMTFTCSMSNKSNISYVPVYKFFFSCNSLY